MQTKADGWNMDDPSFFIGKTSTIRKFSGLGYCGVYTSKTVHNKVKKGE